MQSRNKTQPPYFIQTFIFMLATLLTFPVYAVKVTLDPANWGLAQGKSCISCHQKSSAGLTHQWQQSAHAQAKVNCFDCHQADAGDADAFEHEGEVIATIVSPKDCGRCHQTETQEATASTHNKALLHLEQKFPKLAQKNDGQGLKQAGCTDCHGTRVTVKADGTIAPDSWPNTGIGRINPDGSIGSCSACHGRHSFSKAQARDPQACAWCHSGSESPDTESYASSKHGMLYQSHRADMNLDSEQWVTGKDYAAAPTCVTCHMSAAPGIKSSHDVGMRSAWELSTPISEKQSLVIFADGDRREVAESEPAPKRGAALAKVDGSMAKVKAVASPKRRRQIMSKVCIECHSKGFTQGFMRNFDNFVKHYNEKYAKPAAAIMQDLYAQGKLTPEKLDEPLEQHYWQLWHDDGIRARHGAAMASPTQAWTEGMHRVAKRFNGDWTTQLKALVGEQEALRLLQKYTGETDAAKDAIEDAIGAESAENTQNTGK